VNPDPDPLPPGVLEHVAAYAVRNQVGTWAALKRHAHVGHTTMVTVVTILEDLGVLGPAGPRATREVLVPYSSLNAVLAKVRAYEREDST
jgi:hypothetical protein